MAPKKKYGKQDWREDGDSAHWGAAKRTKKKVTGKIYDGAGASGRTGKYTGNHKITRKRIVKK